MSFNHCTKGRSRNGNVQKRLETFSRKIILAGRRIIWPVLIKEYISLLSAEDKNASDKFWELEKKIKTDRRHPGVILNMEQSKAIYDIISLVRFGVISFDDLADFSEDLQQEVKLILNR